jgi:hypothetical protein
MEEQRRNKEKWQRKTHIDAVPGRMSPWCISSLLVLKLYKEDCLCFYHYGHSIKQKPLGVSVHVRCHCSKCDVRISSSYTAARQLVDFLLTNEKRIPTTETGIWVRKV